MYNGDQTLDLRELLDVQWRQSTWLKVITRCTMETKHLT